MFTSPSRFAFRWHRRTQTCLYIFTYAGGNWPPYSLSLVRPLVFQFKEAVTAHELMHFSRAWESLPSDILGFVGTLILNKRTNNSCYRIQAL